MKFWLPSWCSRGGLSLDGRRLHTATTPRGIRFAIPLPSYPRRAVCSPSLQTRPLPTHLHPCAASVNIRPQIGGGCVAAKHGSVENHLDRHRVVDSLLAARQRTQPWSKDHKLACRCLYQIDQLAAPLRLKFPGVSKIEQWRQSDLRQVGSITACQRHPPMAEADGSHLDPRENASCRNYIRALNLGCFRSAGPDVRNAKVE